MRNWLKPAVLSVLTTLLLPGFSWAALRVAIAPFRGDAKYPLVMSGLRQVLVSDLGQVGQVEVVETSVPPEDITPFKLPDLASQIGASVVLVAHFSEGQPDFTVSLRAYDVETGYSLGSADVLGRYKDIKGLQDRMLVAAAELLRTPIAPMQRSQIAQSHTSAIGAVQALGEADVAMREKKFVDAFQGFARSRSLDANFKAPQLQLQKLGPTTMQKMNDPVSIARAFSFIGDTKRAVAEFDSILAKNPQDVSAMIGKGDTLMQLGKPLEAIPLYQKALAVNPQEAFAAAGLARALAAAGKTADSVAAFERARKLGATDPDIYESLGSAYYAKGQRKQAAEAYQVAGELSERQVNFEKAQRYYSRVNEIQPDVASLERQGALFIAQGDYQLAITMLTKAIFLDPNRDTIYSSMGYAYFLSGQYADALKRFQKAYELNPGNFEANLYIGLILIKERESRSLAVKHLEKASAIRPQDRLAQSSLAEAYLLENKIAGAVEVLDRLAKTYPRDASIQKALGDAYSKGEEFDRAVIAYNRATELNPTFREAYEALASAYIKLGRRDEAIAAVEKVYAIDASRNVFLGGNDAILSALTPGELVNLARSFRKTVTGASGDVFVNQIAVVQVNRDKHWVSRLRKLFALHHVDIDRIQRDFELALYAQFRVIPQSRLKGVPSSINLDDFKTPSYMAGVVSKDVLDGVAGFYVTDASPRGNVATVTLDTLFFTTADNDLFHNTNSQVTYIAKEILRFNPTAPIAYGVVIFLLFGPLVYFTVYRSIKRGRGNLRVVINYDPKLESFLTLKLSTSQEKEKDPKLVIVRDKKKYQKSKYKELVRQRGAWVRKMVGKVTLFERVPARSYYCYLYGTIEDTSVSRATIGNYYMVQRVEIEKGQTKEVLFQLEKEEAFVTIFVRKGETDITGAEIRVDKDPDVKYSRGEAGAFIYLGKGKHTIRITHEGRTVEQAIEIRDLDDRIMNIDLLSVEEVQEQALEGKNLTEVAQEWEAQGRHEDAAQLYEKAGATDRAGEARAQAAVAEGDLEAAAEAFVKSRDFVKAADMYRQIGNMQKANYLYGLHCFQEGELQKAVEYLEPTENWPVLVKVYEKMGDKKNMQLAMAKTFLAKGQKIEAAQAFIQAEALVQAAELYEALGDFSKAALLHAKDGNYQLSGDLFAQAGDVKKAAMAYEKGGLMDQAIPLYEQLGETEKVIELLVRDERFSEAALLYKKQGLLDEAIALCQKVPSYHAGFPASQVLLAQMFSEKGMDDLAIKTFNEVRGSNPDAMDTEALYVFGLLLERSKDYAGALGVFEGLLTRDFHYKDVSIKVNELKSKAATQKKSAAAAASGATIAAGAPAADNRYEIIEELGRGAMGIVYKAKDKMLDRIVAFKTLPHTLKDDPQALDSLMKEAQTAAKLNHPNIVTVYDIGQEAGNYFMAMEYVQGKTLQQVLKQVKRVNLDNFLNIAKPLCEVIAYAHEQKVIHRDIKPSNILLLPTRTVKLMDFGLAKVLEEMSIDKTMLRGTPLYMSPEQVLGKDIDHRTDIYSLGVLFYEMLAGQPPFIQGDIMYAHLHTLPPALGQRVPGVPAPVVDAIMSCLEKDKSKRPTNAKDLLNRFSKSQA